PPPYAPATQPHPPPFHAIPHHSTPLYRASYTREGARLRAGCSVYADNAARSPRPGALPLQSTLWLKVATLGPTCYAACCRMRRSTHCSHEHGGGAGALERVRLPMQTEAMRWPARGPTE